MEIRNGSDCRKEKVGEIVILTPAIFDNVDLVVRVFVMMVGVDIP